MVIRVIQPATQTPPLISPCPSFVDASPSPPANSVDSQRFLTVRLQRMLERLARERPTALLVLEEVLRAFLDDDPRNN